MLLTRFRITKFRSVEDSGWIDADEITALIGTNESGKTNILLPLWKLNPAEGGKIILADDLPRDEYHLYRDSNEKPVFIRAEYSLSEKELSEIADLIERDSSDMGFVIISRDFDGDYYFEFPNLDESPKITIKEIDSVIDGYIKSLNDFSSNSSAENIRKSKVLEVLKEAKAKLGSDKSILETLNAIKNDLSINVREVKSSTSFAVLDELKEYIDNSIDELSVPSILENRELEAYLLEYMPKYVYYSNYGNLDSQIYLPQVIENFERKDLGVKDTAKVRTLKTLFDFVNLNPKEILSLGSENNKSSLTAKEIEELANKKKERDILLSSASSGFTKAFNEWWKQGDYTFEFQADGNFFRIWVSDKIRPERIELESRSTGLQWFFSFYLVFLVESKKHHKNAILLLDEPGVTLHPLAQKDLFIFFENLANENQIIYTTHSPFMVDSNHLDRVRSIFIDKSGKTVASPDLRAVERMNGNNQSQSIYPAHAALGLTVSDTLLINCEPVLVEGTSDQIYLSALKSLLISKGKIAPLKELVFIPTGGTKGIKATAAILSGRSEVKPVVLVDGDKPGMKIAAELKSGFYADVPQRIINISEYTNLENGEIEDLFSAEKFADIVCKFLPRPEEVEEEFDDVVNDNSSICDQIEDYAKNYGILLEKGWKVRLANIVKKEILKGKGKILSEGDSEFQNVLELFNKILNETIQLS